MKKRVVFCAFLISTFLCISSSGFGLVTVTSIQMDPAGVKFFDASTDRFVLEDLGGNVSIDIQQGDISTTSGTYKFDGTLTIAPSDMTLGPIGDAAMFGNTAGGVQSTITIVATRVWKEGGSDVFVSTVTLLEADMTTTGWILQEQASNAELYKGQTDYDITGGELLNGTQLRMADFTLYYGLNGVTPINQSFGQDMISNDPDIKLQAPVPEPATMLLLGLGTMLAVRRKK